MTSFGGINGFNMMFTIFPVLFIIVFVIVIGAFIARAARGIKRYAKNEASPVLTVEARVAAKRTDVMRNMSDDDHMHHPSITLYFVTFEVESGDRLEFAVGGEEYGALAECDRGRLTFRGTRYLGFVRAAGN